MSYLPELHRCAWCNVDLGPDNGDGTCASCDEKVVECEECGNLRMPDAPCAPCEEYENYIEHAPTNATQL